MLAFKVLGIGVPLAIWPVLMSRARRELERQGLDAADARRVAFTMPPSRAELLDAAAHRRVLAPVRAAQAAAPRRLAARPAPVRSCATRTGCRGHCGRSGSQAAVAARQLLVSIEHADREIAELARSLDPGEEERLAAKIAALGGASASASAEVRPLLEKQLALVRELSSRIEEGRAERSRRVEMLKTLALHLASLRARAAEAPAEVPSLSERVRQLCDEIGGQALALAEARARQPREHGSADAGTWLTHWHESNRLPL